MCWHDYLGLELGGLPARNHFDMDKEERLISGAPLIDLIRDVLGQGSSINLIAKGFSMAPFIKDGDVLTLAPLSISAPAFGDVVAFKSSKGNKLAIHRVIKAHKDRYLMKGDSCSEPDGYIPKDDVLGLLSRINRAGKRIAFGLGPEKTLIAFLSARSLLCPLLSLMNRGFTNNSRPGDGFQTI